MLVDERLPAFTLVMVRVAPGEPTLNTLDCPPPLLPSPIATELFPVDCAPAPIATELPPEAIVELAEELPIAMLPLVPAVEPLAFPAELHFPWKARRRRIKQDGLKGGKGGNQAGRTGTKLAERELSRQ